MQSYCHLSSLLRQFPFTVKLTTVVLDCWQVTVKCDYGRLKSTLSYTCTRMED